MAAAGSPKAAKDGMLGRPINRELEKLLASRSVYTAPADPGRRVQAVSERAARCWAAPRPSWVSGDIEGGVCLLSPDRADPPDDAETGAVRIAASFLARWMEE